MRKVDSVIFRTRRFALRSNLGRSAETGRPQKKRAFRHLRNVMYRDIGR